METLQGRVGSVRTEPRSFLPDGRTLRRAATSLPLPLRVFAGQLETVLKRRQHPPRLFRGPLMTVAVQRFDQGELVGDVPLALAPMALGPSESIFGRVCHGLPTIVTSTFAGDRTTASGIGPALDQRGGG